MSVSYPLVVPVLNTRDMLKRWKSMKKKLSSKWKISSRQLCLDNVAEHSNWCLLRILIPYDFNLEALHSGAGLLSSRVGRD